MTDPNAADMARLRAIETATRNLAPFLAALPRYRRIAREAQATCVGTHWPSMDDMRRDGIGHGLAEDRAHERRIRRFLDTFQPEFVADLMERLNTLRAAWEETP